MSALECLASCLVRVLVPIVHDQPVCVVDVEPAGFDKQVDQLSFFPVPFQPAFDGEVGILANVALRCVPAREVPHTFEITKDNSFRHLQERLQMSELGVVWYSS